ncbi:MAG: DNA recombination protein RmuC [candidate division Zixibacteria bacterium]|nr:DNA recombination protein RmuC [candidate division Zixibacteria bacterium]
MEPIIVIITIILAVILAVILAALIWLTVSTRRFRTGDRLSKIETIVTSLKSELLEKQMEGLLSLRSSLDSANRLLNERLAEGTNTLDKRLNLFVEIENKLGQLEIQAKNIESVGRDIGSLSELLKPPQLRGELGEIFLENLLGQILPSALFATQYQLSGGQRVDAVVKLADRLLPIDSKFPLSAFEQLVENQETKDAQKEFVRTFRKHIDSISMKYIRPDENTTDVAVMYIPSEAVYFQFVTGHDSDGLEYALSKKVIPSSPGHLYAFLASFSAMYKEAGLASDSRRLVAGINALSESLTRLSQLHDRIEGSARALAKGVTKARGEITEMSGQIEKLHQPAQDANDNENTMKTAFETAPSESEEIDVSGTQDEE